MYAGIMLQMVLAGMLTRPIRDDYKVKCKSSKSLDEEAQEESKAGIDDKSIESMESMKSMESMEKRNKVSDDRSTENQNRSDPSTHNGRVHSRMASMWAFE